MKSLDNTIKYYELLMRYNDTSIVKHYDLPSGFHYEYYQDEDEKEWKKFQSLFLTSKYR